MLFTELLEREKKKNISFTFLFTLASKIIKYLGINITKEVKDQYIENYKTPMKEIEDTNKWKDILCSCVERILLKCSCYSKQTIDSSIPIKIPMAFFTDAEKHNPKISIESQKSMNSQNTLNKDEQS